MANHTSNTLHLPLFSIFQPFSHHFYYTKFTKTFEKLTSTFIFPCCFVFIWRKEEEHRKRGRGVKRKGVSGWITIEPFDMFSRGLTCHSMTCYDMLLACFHVSFRPSWITVTTPIWCVTGRNGKNTTIRSLNNELLICLACFDMCLSVGDMLFMKSLHVFRVCFAFLWRFKRENMWTEIIQKPQLEALIMNYWHV